MAEAKNGESTWSKILKGTAWGCAGLVVLFVGLMVLGIIVGTDEEPEWLARTKLRMCHQRTQ